MATTDKAAVSQRTNTYAEAKMLAHAEPVLVLQKFGQMKPMPKNKADNVTFRRPVPFTVSTTALTEGVKPTAKAMSYEDVTATLAQYGGLVEITDQVHDTVEDPVLNDAAMLSGEEAGETLELVLWNVLRAGTNVQYSNGTARNQVNSKISLSTQRAITRTLKSNKGKKITQMVSSSVKYGTEAIDAAYIAIGHTDLEADIRDMTNFVPVEKYGTMKPLPYEIGKVEDVRYILSPTLTNFADAGGLASTNNTVSTTGTNSDVYPILFFAKEAFGCVTLKGHGAITPSIINPGQLDKSDPLGQLGYVGWKTYFAGVRLNETWMVRAEVAASDL